MARIVDSGHETVTSEDEEDSLTPRHSPLTTNTTFTVVTDPEQCNASNSGRILLGSQLPTSISGTHTSTNTNVNTNTSSNPNPNPNSTAGSNNDSCSQCKFRRVPITSEHDLYRLASTCTHHKSLSQHPHHHNNNNIISSSHTQSQSLSTALPPPPPLMNKNRSSSAMVYGEHNRERDPEFNMDSIRRPPPKLTGALVNSCTKAIIRPIAFKPTEIGARLHPNYSSMKQSLERRNSENFLRRGNPERMERMPPELSIVPPNQNNTLNSQRFGGSLCNVLPSKEFSNNRNGSTLHIEDVGITPLHVGKMCDLASPHISYDPYQYEDKETVGLEKGFENEMKHLRAAHQRAIKLEQALAAHSCQIQQERRNLRTELDTRNSQLEESEWAICLLKAQLKDCQGDQASRSHEVVQLRNHVKTLAAEVTTLRANLSQANFNHKAAERENASLKQKLLSQEKVQRNLNEENELLRKKLKEMELKHSFDSAMWDTERSKWREEQNRVLRYQQLLQKNYVLSCQKVESLERLSTNNAKYQDNRTGSLQKS